MVRIPGVERAEGSALDPRDVRGMEVSVLRGRELPARAEPIAGDSAPRGLQTELRRA